MGNFEVIQGGLVEKRDYKPSALDYSEALLRTLEKLISCYGEEACLEDVAVQSNEFRRALWLYVKSIGSVREKDFNQYDEEYVVNAFVSTECIFGMFSRMTPRQVIQLFPIEKIYDGKRWQVKDYFSTMEAVNEIGMDNVIGEEKTPLFLMDYQNPDINEFMVMFMMTVSRMRVLQGGKEPVEEFFEEHGVATYSYYEDEGILVNRQSGEASKVQKPKPRIPKYMKIIEGGLN